MANNADETYAERDAELDEELAEVLIAISVISKRLAKKITANHMVPSSWRISCRQYAVIFCAIQCALSPTDSLSVTFMTSLS